MRIEIVLHKGMGKWKRWLGKWLGVRAWRRKDGRVRGLLPKSLSLLAIQGRYIRENKGVLRRCLSSQKWVTQFLRVIVMVRIKDILSRIPPWIVGC